VSENVPPKEMLDRLVVRDDAAADGCSSLDHDTNNTPRDSAQSGRYDH